MRRILKYDFAVMLHKKEFAVAMIGMLLLSVYSLYYAGVIQGWYGWQDTNIVSGNLVSMLFSYSRAWQIFVYLFAFLSVLPYSLSFVSELDCGMLPVVLTRTGKGRYFISKLITCFAGNAAVVFVPLMLNWICCRLAFSDLPHLPGVQYGMLNYTNFINNGMWYISVRYPVLVMADMFINHTSWYVFLYILQMTAAAGLAGVLLLGLSFIMRRHRAALFFPLFLFIRLSSAVSSYCLETALIDENFVWADYSLMDYFQIGINYPTGPWFLPVLCLLQAIFLFIIWKFVVQKDSMLLGEGI